MRKAFVIVIVNFKINVGLHLVSTDELNCI